MSKVAYRVVIKLLSNEWLAPAAIKQRLDGVYGEASPSYSAVNEWAKQFRLGRESVEDEPRDGRPLEVVAEENMGDRLRIDAQVAEWVEDQRAGPDEAGVGDDEYLSWHNVPAVSGFGRRSATWSGREAALRCARPRVHQERP